MPEPTEIERDLRLLEADLKRLEAEYNMFFAGRLPRPPWETRTRVDALVKRYDRAHIQSYADRFRFATLQSRYQTFADLWDRAMRAREEGRPGPFSPRADTRAAERTEAGDRVVHVAAFADPVHEIDRLRELHARVEDARRETGEAPVPFHRFAKLIKDQVRRMQTTGSGEVTFRVAIKDGKVNLTADVLRGIAPRD